jgi:hypothetical protein
MYPGENPPIGLILCSKKNKELAHYALGNLRNIAAIEHKINHYREALISEMEQAQKFYSYQYQDLRNCHTRPLDRLIAESW